jgi:hypothetical protein
MLSNSFKITFVIAMANYESAGQMLYRLHHSIRLNQLIDSFSPQLIYSIPTVDEEKEHHTTRTF